MTDYVRPSYRDLLSRIAADINSVPAVLRDPLARALAKAGHSQHGYLAWIDRQCSPLTCELERLYDWASLYGVERLMATAATGSVLATGEAGTEVLAGTQLRGTNGLDYTTTAAVTLGVGTTAVSIRCDKAGSASNLAVGKTLMLIDPVPGCDSTVSVGAGGLSGGANDELVDAWRARVADEWRVVATRGARSGKPDDYRFWARSAHPSVTTALIELHTLGVGTVVVRPVCNTLANRLPTQAVLDAVEARLIDIAPATADWRLGQPIPRVVNIDVALDAEVDTAPNRTAIEQALAALVLDEIGELAALGMAEIDAAIATVTTQYTRIAPVEDIAASVGQILVLGAVAWV